MSNMNCRITSEGNIRLENVPGTAIKFRHLSGEKDQYHAPGQRDFNIALPQEFADELIVNGWRVKLGKEKEDGTRYDPMIKVKVNFSSFKPPVITRWTSRGPVNIDESLAKDIDWDEIESAAFIITPYNYDGKKTPYLQNMRYKIEEDPFVGMYEDEGNRNDDWMNG